jgi:hypothetical protein
MSPVTFLVTVEIDPDTESLNEIAEQIANKLDTEFVVTSVRAWKRPTLKEKPQPVTPKGQQVLAAFAAASGVGSQTNPNQLNTNT